MCFEHPQQQQQHRTHTERRHSHRKKFLRKSAELLQVSEIRLIFADEIVVVMY